MELTQPWSKTMETQYANFFYQIFLQGNEIDRAIKGKLLLYKPNTCQALVTQ